MDAEGFVLAVEVTAANLNARQGLYLLLSEDKAKFPRLRKIWADMGYLGEDTKWTVRNSGCDLEVVKKPQASGFIPQFKRWVVERTFAWFGKFRRLSKDYGYRVCSSVSMIYLSMTRLLLKRLEASG